MVEQFLFSVEIEMTWLDSGETFAPDEISGTRDTEKEAWDAVKENIQWSKSLMSENQNPRHKERYTASVIPYELRVDWGVGQPRIAPLNT